MLQLRCGMSVKEFIVESSYCSQFFQEKVKQLIFFYLNVLINFYLLSGISWTTELHANPTGPGSSKVELFCLIQYTQWRFHQIKICSDKRWGDRLSFTGTLLSLMSNYRIVQWKKHTNICQRRKGVAQERSESTRANLEAGIPSSQKGRFLSSLSRGSFNQSELLLLDSHKY